jgi:hypothetical protein
MRKSEARTHRWRQRELHVLMEDYLLSCAQLAMLSGYSETSIKRFRCGLRPISDRAWHVLTLSIGGLLPASHEDQRRSQGL